MTKLLGIGADPLNVQERHQDAKIWIGLVRLFRLLGHELRLVEIEIGFSALVAFETNESRKLRADY